VKHATLCTLPNASKSVTVLLHTSTAAVGLVHSDAPGSCVSEYCCQADGNNRQ
jgi:hypothetical protein